MWLHDNFMSLPQRVAHNAARCYKLWSHGFLNTATLYASSRTVVRILESFAMAEGTADDTFGDALKRLPAKVTKWCTEWRHEARKICNVNPELAVVAIHK